MLVSPATALQSHFRRERKSAKARAQKKERRWPAPSLLSVPLPVEAPEQAPNVRLDVPLSLVGTSGQVLTLVSREHGLRRHILRCRAARFPSSPTGQKDGKMVNSQALLRSEERWWHILKFERRYSFGVIPKSRVFTSGTRACPEPVERDPRINSCLESK